MDAKACFINDRALSLAYEAVLFPATAPAETIFPVTRRARTSPATNPERAASSPAKPATARRATRPASAPPQLEAAEAIEGQKPQTDKVQ